MLNSKLNTLIYIKTVGQTLIGQILAISTLTEDVQVQCKMYFVLSLDDSKRVENFQRSTLQWDSMWLKRVINFQCNNVNSTPTPIQ